MPPTRKRHVLNYTIERCCEDLTHETFFVCDSGRNVIATLPSEKAAEDLIYALNDGSAAEEFGFNVPSRANVTKRQPSR
jgi:hypothetical protein